MVFVCPVWNKDERGETDAAHLDTPMATKKKKKEEQKKIKEVPFQYFSSEKKKRQHKTGQPSETNQTKKKLHPPPFFFCFPQFPGSATPVACGTTHFFFFCSTVK